LTYPIVETGQVACYDTTNKTGTPAVGEAFYGQDAQFTGFTPSYTRSTDGKTVTDNVTGLMWQSTPDVNEDGTIDANDKLTIDEAEAHVTALNDAAWGGYTDWRLPTIKELYSLITFIGTDPPPEGTSTDGMVPFIDTTVFDFAYGDISAGERIIDMQYASSTRYVSTTMNGQVTQFGVNFADGRIKGYGLGGLGPIGGEKTFAVQCVRGNTLYGINSFVDNGDNTITDTATGLMWPQDDSGTGMDWETTLAWVQQKNTENYLGHSDWRLPDVKELQSIVDYSRSPATTNSAAINPLFQSTSILNEAGQTDWPCYWSGTTHLAAHMLGTGNARRACYVSFGRGMGFMGDQWMDVHGAGSQRSDPKAGDESVWGTAEGPQGDAIRIFNHVRLVRTATTTTSVDKTDGASTFPTILELAQNTPNPFNPVTTIPFTLVDDGAVSLRIYNTMGQLVRTLVSEYRSTGAHSVVWNGRDDAGKNIASGVYVYALATAGKIIVKRMTLVR
jgi:hypothetical protein